MPHLGAWMNSAGRVVVDCCQRASEVLAVLAGGNGRCKGGTRRASVGLWTEKSGMAGRARVRV
jgi:hypothetical protein